MFGQCSLKNETLMGLYLYLGFSSQFIVYTLSFNFLLFISSVVPISYYGYVLIF